MCRVVACTIYYVAILPRLGEVTLSLQFHTHFNSDNCDEAGEYLVNLEAGRQMAVTIIPNYGRLPSKVKHKLTKTSLAVWRCPS